MSGVRVALAIAQNELRRLLADRTILVFGLGLPVIIITLIGLTFGSTGSIDVGVLDQDDSVRSAALIRRLEDLEAVDVVRYEDIDKLRRDVRSTSRQAGLVIPAGYAGAVAAGDARLELVADPTSEGVATALATVDGVVREEGVQEGAIRYVAAQLDDEAEARRLVGQTAFGLVPVALQDVGEVEESAGAGSFSYTAPANLVLFVFINTFAVSTLIAVERKEGILRRLLSTPHRPGTILAGIGASKLLFALMQSAILVAAGWLLFGVHWGDPLAALALVVVFAALATAVGLLVGAIVTDADQAQAVGIPLAVALGMLGGCMWPLAIVPVPMQVAGHLAPHAWAMDAWQELVFDGGGLGDIALQLGVLTGAALVLGVLAARQLRRSIVG